MGVIYLITCKATNKLYVGQTKKTIQERIRSHMESFRQYVRCQEEPDYKPSKKIRKSALYAAMYKYGIGNFEVEILIDNADEFDLDFLEIELIKIYDCLSPKGYNLTTGGSNGFTFSPDVRKRLSESSSKFAKENPDLLRRDETKGLPQHITFKVKKNGIEIYAINLHPLCKFKQFQVNLYGSHDAAKKAAIEFLNELNIKQETYKKEKKEDLITGLFKIKGGYLVRKVHKKKTYEKRFINGNLTDDENKQNAINWLNKLLESFKNK